MGSLHNFARNAHADAFTPANHRPAHICRLLILGEESRKTYDAEAVQYALGEEEPDGYHVVETPDSSGPMLRWVCRGPLGRISLRDTKAGSFCCLYAPGEVHIVGRVFQFIRSLHTGERWELVTGPVHAGREDLTAALYEEGLLAAGE
jgi:hypothetical protein